MTDSKSFFLIFFILFSCCFDLDAGHEVEEPSRDYPGGPWVFIEDELLLLPGYVSLLGFIPAMLVSSLARSGIEELRKGNQDGWIKNAMLVNFPAYSCGFFAGWAYKSIVYMVVLYNFFNNWEKNKLKIPIELQVFFGEEHKFFCEGKIDYIIKNTKRVIKTVRGVVTCRNGGFKFGACCSDDS